MSRHIPYRPEIDGLRALAVSAVLVYHLKPAWLPGGFLGVDIFFVISGFLISSIMLKGWENSSFSFKEFYMRRARRILPALLVVTALSSMAAYWVLFPDDLQDAARACRSTMLCYPNYFFGRGTGYFTPAAESNPFLHTWSLGLEEQFYLIFPCVGLFLFRRVLFTQFYLTLFVLADFALAFVMNWFHPTHAFFALETRAWQLAAGACLAVRVSQSARPLVKMSDAWGLMLALPPMFLAGKISAPFNSALAAGGAFLFIASCQRETTSGIQRVFGMRPLRFLGRISYSLYLVHWPTIVLSRAWWGELNTEQALMAAAASFVLAIALHFLVEEPVRSRKILVHSPTFIATLIICAGTLITACQFAISRGGNINRSLAEQRRNILPDAPLAMDLRQAAKRLRKVDADGTPKAGAGACIRVGSISAEPSVGLWGDSHAMALCPELSRSLDDAGLCCEAWGRGGDIPALNLHTKEDRFNEDAVQALSRPQIRHVIIAARWSLHIDGGTADLGPAEQWRRTNTKVPGARSPEQAKELICQGLHQALLRLSKQQVILVYPVPEVGQNVPALLCGWQRVGRDIASVALRAPAAYYPIRHELAIAMLQELQSDHNTIGIHPEKFLIQDGELRISQDGKALYKDDDHLSRLGSRPIVSEIMQLLQAPAP